jgi:hypothetical protein
VDCRLGQSAGQGQCMSPNQVVRTFLATQAATVPPTGDTRLCRVLPEPLHLETPPAGMGAGCRCNVGASSSSSNTATMLSRPCSVSPTAGCEAPRENVLDAVGVENTLDELEEKNEGIEGAMVRVGAVRESVGQLDTTDLLPRLQPEDAEGRMERLCALPRTSTDSGRCCERRRTTVK